MAKTYPHAIDLHDEGSETRAPLPEESRLKEAAEQMAEAAEAVRDIHGRGCECHICEDAIFAKGAAMQPTITINSGLLWCDAVA